MITINFNKEFTKKVKINIIFTLFYKIINITKIIKILEKLRGIEESSRADFSKAVNGQPVR